MMNSDHRLRAFALATLSSLLLVACPHTDVTEIPFDSDPSILRGSWGGTVIEVCNKPFQLLDWNTPSGELLAARPYFRTASRQAGAKISVWNASSGTKKLEWDVPWPTAKNAEFIQTFQFAAFENQVAAYDTRRVLLFDRSNGAALGDLKPPAADGNTQDLNAVTLSTNLERYLRVIADKGYAYNNPGAIRAQVFEVGTGQRIFDLALGEPLMGLALNSDGSWVAVSLPKKGVTVYEVSSGKPLYNVSANSSGNLSFSPDSKLLSVPKDGGFQVWKLDNGQATPAQEGVQNAVGKLLISDGGCSVQLPSTDGIPGQRLDLEPLENVSITLELSASYVNKDSYTVAGTARFKNTTFTVSGKVNGKTSTEFLKPQHAPPQPIVAELNLLENGQSRYTFNLYGSPSYARYGSAYGGLSAVAWDDRLFSLELTKP